MTVKIHITDTTNKDLFQEDAENPLELINEKIKKGELIVDSFTCDHNVLTGITETDLYLRDKTPKLNTAYYQHKQMMVAQRMEKKHRKPDKLDCHYCEHHTYDWFDDGDEFEVCEKNHELHPDKCPDFEELL